MLLSLKFRAFTLVELLVVIVIIAILSSIAVATYADYQRQARVSKLLNDYKLIENFFVQEAVVNNNGQFFIDNYFDGNDNPTMQEVIDNYAPAREYFGGNLTAPFGDKVYFYDNDDDTFQCGVGGVPGLAYGVSIFIENVHQNEANAVLEAYGESGDPLCGKVLFLALNGDYGLLGIRISDSGNL